MAGARVPCEKVFELVKDRSAVNVVDLQAVFKDCREVGEWVLEQGWLDHTDADEVPVEVM